MTQTIGLGRKTAVLFVFIALFLILAIRGSIVGATEQEDAKAPDDVTATLDMQFSSDGTTFSDNLSVNQGDTVWVRLNYDNTGDEQGTGAAAALTLPAGFTLVGSSTKTCLTPAGVEIVCNSDAGMGGAITEGSVWAGQVLGIAPQAGLYAEAVGATSGILEFGKVRYVNLHECRSELAGQDIFYTSLDGTGTNASNTADNIATCGTYAGYVTTPNQALNLDLLGQRYLNLQDCQYFNGSERIGVNTANTTTSNTAIAAHTCPPTAGAHNLEAADIAALELKGNPFLNLKECQLKAGADNIFFNLRGGADTDTGSVADTAYNCSAGFPYAVVGDTQLPLDVRDSARGAGYIEFQMTAGAAAGAHTFSPTLDGNEFSQQTDSGDVTVMVDPVTHIVTSVDDADDGVCSPAPAHCSLREAIKYSNPGDTINFDAGIASGTIILDPTTNGALTQINDLVIDGTTQNITITNLTYPATIFSIASDKSATFRNLTMTLLGGSGGTSHKSGLLSLTHGGSLTLDTVTVQDSSAVDYGFIYAGLNSGTITPTVTITNSTFTNNSGSTYGAGVMSMYAGTLNVTNSDFIGNTAANLYPGALNTHAETTIENSTFISNTTYGAVGGAIASSNALTITNSSFEENSAASTGGAIYTTGSLNLTSTDFISNTSGSHGGAIYNTGAVAVNTSGFIGNHTLGGGADGGALYNTGTLEVNNSAFTNNYISDSSPGTEGGAIIGVFANSVITVTGSSFISNTALIGGAVTIWDGISTFENNTFFDNGAGSHSGALFLNNLSTNTLLNNTISNNDAPVSAGLRNDGTLTLINNIIANSTTSDDCTRFC